MEAGLQEHIAFYLTGRKPAAGLEGIDHLDLRPALLANYRDLTTLRYDFPLVLVDNGAADRSCVRSLSAVIDGLVREIADDNDRDRIFRHALRMERGIRSAVAAGAKGTLSDLWDDVANLLTANGDDRLNDSLLRTRAALTIDGNVIDCRRETPAQFIEHAWSRMQLVRAGQQQREIDRLILKLSNILRVDFVHSDRGRSAELLKAAVGTAHADLFDFDVMSRLLSESSGTRALPASRRQRIEQLLEMLRSQRVFSDQPNTYVFHDCASALDAYQSRMPGAIELARTIAIAKLEIDSQYDEPRHDELFAEFGRDGLDAEEAARFPDYLICLDAAQLHGAEHETLTGILSAGLPMKVLVQFDDILETTGARGEAHLLPGSRSRQLTNMAIGLNDVFVLQVSGSHLFQARDRILDGLAYEGPALFSVFSGASASTGNLPPYLVASAANESRAFPAFTYNPHAGETWAERFSIEPNPSPELDWPVHPFAYEDGDHQRVEASIEFTLADFVSCDRRFARHFARTSRTDGSDTMMTVGESLGQAVRGVPEKIPSILAVDGQNRLHRVIVDDTLIRATQRCRDAWHSLQELGGIHSSIAERVLARERVAWEAEVRPDTTIASPMPKPLAGVAAAPVETRATDDSTQDEAEPGPTSDEAYVETARCTTCNECTQINSKMFAYDENQQCHIVDLHAGTFRQLVEAAENCQVAIIHPGKPWDLSEPGLEELIERAAEFN